MMPPRPRILCVDDEPMVLAALRDTLRRRFDVTVAEGGQAGLNALGADGPFAVVVSDFMMPGMNGAEFLAFARVAAPDTVRVLLSGQATVENAIAVVNDGNIFRFLTKPCAPPDLLRALDDAVEQSRLLTADNALVERKLDSISAQLLQAERLASIGTLAGAIGHELMAVAAELIEASEPIRHDAALGRAPSPESLELLSRTQNRVMLHARNLLALGSPVPQEPDGATDLRRAVRDVLHMLRGAGQFRQVAVRLDLPATTVPVLIEPAPLQRVLLNVIKNAVEALASVRRPDPTIAVAVVESAGGRAATCTVTDNGAGIEPAHLPLLFEPYFTTKARHDGAGLGLFAVQQIMRAAGGDVSVEARGGSGTVFALTFPSADMGVEGGRHSVSLDSAETQMADPIKGPAIRLERRLA